MRGLLSLSAKGISIGSAVFAGVTVVIITRTDTETRNVTNSPHLSTAMLAMRPNQKYCNSLLSVRLSVIIFFSNIVFRPTVCKYAL